MLAPILLLATTAAGQVTATAATATQVFDECRQLFEARSYPAAARRCADAMGMDPRNPDIHYFLGRAHAILSAPHLIAGQGVAVPPVTDEEASEHRAKAQESLRRFLAATSRMASEWQRGARPDALLTLIGTYQSDANAPPDATMVEFASELDRIPNLHPGARWIVAMVYERNGHWPRAEAVLRRVVDDSRWTAYACTDLARLYLRPVWSGRARFDDFVSTLERCAADDPSDPTGHQLLAMFLWDKVFRDTALSDVQRLAYAERGLRAVERALAIDKDFLEAVVYKGLLLRLKARDTTNAVQQKRLLDEANALSERARVLREAGVPLRRIGERFAGLAPPSPPAPPPPPSAPGGGGVTGGVPGGVVVAEPPAAPPPPQAVRVGGAIKEPKRLKNVPPAYPDIAKQARVQGVVILECTISPEGKVIDVKILRGIPLLDQAAVDAVKQWVYAPTLLNGVPVPVIMTVTVNFTLS